MSHHHHKHAAALGLALVALAAPAAAARPAVDAVAPAVSASDLRAPDQREPASPVNAPGTDVAAVDQQAPREVVKPTGGASDGTDPTPIILFAGLTVLAIAGLARAATIKTRRREAHPTT